MKTCEIDGRRVRYVEAGSGEPVLLLHGYPQSLSCWRHQLPALAAGHRVIAADWPGFGHSDPPPDVPSYDNEIERVERLSAHFGLDRFNLIAHDYGGFVGLGYVLRHPDRVMRLALLNTRAHGVFRPWFYRFSKGQHLMATHTARPARRLPLGAMHRLALRRYRERGCFDEELLAEYLGWMDTPAGRRTFVEFFKHYHVPQIPWLATGLERITCPTAIVWGDADAYIPFATARELADRIPGATLTRLRGADHYVMEERPDQVTSALTALLELATV
jgi:pimeloyl-ACP methyl ester carboxylesterase